MFKMRREQRESFREQAVRDFEDQVVAHVQRCFAGHWADLGETAVRALIRDGIARAAGYGIVAARDVCTFVDLMLVFGAEFDRRCDWARDILEADAPAAPIATMRRLHRRALEEA